MIRNTVLLVSDEVCGISQNSLLSEQQVKLFINLKGIRCVNSKKLLSITFITFIFLLIIFIAPVSPHSTSIDTTTGKEPEVWLGYNIKNLKNWNGIGNARAESCAATYEHSLSETSKLALIPCLTRIEGTSTDGIIFSERSLLPSLQAKWVHANTIGGTNFGHFLKFGFGVIGEKLRPHNIIEQFATTQFQGKLGLFYNLTIASIKLKPFCGGAFAQDFNFYTDQFSKPLRQKIQVSTEVGLEIRYNSNRGIFGTWYHSLYDSTNIFYFGTIIYQGGI